MPKHKRTSKEDYTKGDVVWYYSTADGSDASRAVFVGYDYEGFPDRDCILAIRIGRRVTKKGKKKKGFIQTFRWPLRGVSPT